MSGPKRQEDREGSKCNGGVVHSLGMTSPPIGEEDSLPSEFRVLPASGTTTMGLLRGKGRREGESQGKEKKKAWRIFTLFVSVTSSLSPLLNQD